jgi:hypothetical protein
VIPIPAVLGPRFVINFASILRVLRGLQKVIHEIHRIVKKIVVSFADVDMKFAFELRTQLRPISFKDVPEIVILTPVVADNSPR